MELTEFTRLHQQFVKEHGLIDWFLRVPAQNRDCTGERGRWLLKQLPKVYVPNLFVVDLCGGHGEYGAYLQAVEGYRFRYVCIDRDKQRVDLGEEYFELFGLEGRFFQGDVNNPLFFCGNTFDLALCFSWCQDKIACEPFFHEVHRVLKRGGNFMFNMCEAKSMKPNYVVGYSLEGLHGLLEKCGFLYRHVDVICGGSEFGVWARKA